MEKVGEQNIKKTLADFEKKPNAKVKLFAAHLKKLDSMKKSSSGGVFYEIAHEVIDKNGVVYGAAFSKDFSVEHIRTSNFEDLEKLRGSKYVQSKMGNTFSNVKNDLLRGLQVLFSGTPCQVAGLKKFLGIDYPNLLTIDVVCHGVPAAKLWMKYLSEVSGEFGSKISSVNFRSKEINWQNPQMIISFNNNNRISSTVYDNPYGHAFLKNIILQEMCYSCQYNAFRNHSDITLGDFWGYANELKDEDFSSGLSLIIVNTDQGQSVLEGIKDKIVIYKNIDVKNALINNYPIIHQAIPNYNREKILKEIEQSGNFVNSVCNNLDELQTFKPGDKSVAILNFGFENYNYGANLISFAMSKTIEKIGYKPYIIDYELYDQINSIERFKTFEMLNFRKKQLLMTPKFNRYDSLEVLNDKFDTFIVGSDQVWRKTITEDQLYKYFFNFVHPSKKIISYAASFGSSSFEGTEDETKNCKLMLKKFDFVSVREIDAIDICKNYFDIEATQVLDPTLLLNSIDYDQIIVDESFEFDYIAKYFILDEENSIENDRLIKKIFNDKKIINIKGEKIEMPWGKEFKLNSVSKWLNGIKNSEFVITDSYHGVIFSIIYNKEFVCIGKNSKALSRFKTLFELLDGDLNERMFSDVSEINPTKFKKINYKKINNVLELLAQKSILFLKESLDSSVNLKSKIDYYESLLAYNKIEVETNHSLQKNVIEKDIFLHNYRNEIELLNSKNNYLESELKSILKSNSWKIVTFVRKVKNCLFRIKK